MAQDDHGPGTEREPAHVGAPAEPENGKRADNGGNGGNGNGGNGNGDKSAAAERPALSSRVGPRARVRESSSSPAPGSGAVRKVRDLLATAVLTVAVLAALVLALGAVLAGLKANVNNPIVSGVLDLANRLDGPFADVFTFTSVIKQTLVNWGIAAAVYLIAGRIIERVIRP
ncbi:hypothetical protein [Flindersiella endophytica]